MPNSDSKFRFQMACIKYIFEFQEKLFTAADSKFKWMLKLVNTHSSPGSAFDWNPTPWNRWCEWTETNSDFIYVAWFTFVFEMWTCTLRRCERYEVWIWNVNLESAPVPLYTRGLCNLNCYGLDTYPYLYLYLFNAQQSCVPSTALYFLSFDDETLVF